MLQQQQQQFAAAQLQPQQQQAQLFMAIIEKLKKDWHTFIYYVYVFFVSKN